MVQSTTQYGRPKVIIHRLRTMTSDDDHISEFMELYTTLRLEETFRNFMELF